MRNDQQDCAVVAGGSVAGLLVARVLAERYPTVVIVERDRLPAGPSHRRGVPQGRQVLGDSRLQCSAHAVDGDVADIRR